MYKNVIWKHGTLYQNFNKYLHYSFILNSSVEKYNIIINIFYIICDYTGTIFLRIMGLSQAEKNY